MSQVTSFTVPNDTFPNTRADFNNINSALQSSNSGSSAPANPVAGQLWYDATNLVLMVYSSGAWQFVQSTFRAALVYRTTDFSVNNNSATVIPWQAADYGATGIWSGGDPTKLIVPPGASIVELSSSLYWDNAGNGFRYNNIRKNGGAAHNGQGQSIDSMTSTASFETIPAVTAPLNVVPGDYFQTVGTQTSGSALKVLAGNVTWMAMKVLR